MKKIVNQVKSNLFITLVIVYFASCSTSKKVVYFQGQQSASDSTIREEYNPIFQTNDLLSINVSGIDPDVAKPFNMSSPTAGSTSSGGTNNMGEYATGSPYLQGYVVYSDSCIDFPVIGKIKIAGMDRLSAVKLLKEKLAPYINHPTVNIRILNYKVTVLGDVLHPATLMIANEKITLPEAIGLVGDLNITGQRKNVLVVRYVNGKKVEYRIDLTSKQLFNSPVYYLHQNDLVYVQPNRAKRNASIVNPNNISLLVSVVSLIITTIILIKQ